MRWPPKLTACFYRASSVEAKEIVRRTLRSAGWICILIICVLSLLPGNWQRRTGLPGPIEHIIAYSVTALVLSLADRTRNFSIPLIVGLTCLAGGLEVAQNWSPGRDPAFIDLVAGMIGATLGVSCAFLMRRLGPLPTAANGGDTAP